MLYDPWTDSYDSDDRGAYDEGYDRYGRNSTDDRVSDRGEQ